MSPSVPARDNHRFLFLHSRSSLVVQYLSEDEAGGGGTSIRPLEAAPPGISPSVDLYEITKTRPSVLQMFCHHIR